MRIEEKIDIKQFTLVVALFSIGTSVLLTPAHSAAQAKESAWMAPLLSYITGVLLISLFIYIGRLQPDLNLFQHNEFAFGKWIGKAMSLILVFYSLIGASTVLWTVGDFMVVQIMPETPIMYICILFMVLPIYGAKLGIETIAKTAEIFFPWIILLLVMIVLLSIPNIDLSQILPLVDTPFSKIISASIFEFSVSTIPLIMVFALFPSFVNKVRKGNIFILIGYLFAGLIITSITFISITVLGADLSGLYSYPTYVMSERIKGVVLLDRLEVFIAISWILTIFFKLFFYFYTSLIGFAQVIGVDNYRPLTVPLGVIVIALSLIVYPDTIYASKWNQDTWVPLSILVGVLYPVILLLASKVKKMRNSNKGDQQ